MLQKRFNALIFFIFIIVKVFSLDSFIRINQLGYTPNGLKKAILISESEISVSSFSIHDALTHLKLKELQAAKPLASFEQFKSIYQLDFSQFQTVGAFYIKAGTVFSPVIFIDKQIYSASVDNMLHYMRQQRCGFNPILKDYCHQHEAVVIPQPVSMAPILAATSNLRKKPIAVEPPQAQNLLTIDLTGGWHNGADYVKYSATTAVSVFQLLYAYRSNPAAFSDNFDANGLPYPNKIPDVLDEARWGLEWLLKMNPKTDVIYVQVGDDRGEDAKWMPANDKTDYGLGDEAVQPAYLATGVASGLFASQNKSTGIASLAGKLASVYALGADIYATSDKVFADMLQNKAVRLYEFAKTKTGVSQSIPAFKNNYLNEDNWVDDMQLASAQLYQLTFEPTYRTESATYGRMEPITPWLFADTVNQYQWFPYTNMGHFMLANSENPQLKDEFIQNIRFGLKRAQLRSAKNPFGVGVPMVQHSNSYIVSLATQCNLYRRYTGDSTFVDMENALVDWLFGCNPWGISMVVGMPSVGGQVLDPYSPLWALKGILPKGGLVAGAVGAGVFANNGALSVKNNTPLDRFQTNWAVFVDGKDGRITNESNIDGTTALVFLLANKQLDDASITKNAVVKQGALVQTDKEKKQITLMFSGNNYNDGIKKIQKALVDTKVKASFFLSGNFLRKSKNKSFVKRMIKEGHYIGAHSDQYPLYAQKDKKNEMLISREAFMADLKRNFELLEKFELNKVDANFFLPPYEMLNDSIELWSKLAGVRLVLPTPGLNSNADISVPEMRENYYSSHEIVKEIIEKESVESLNGNVLLFHLGASNVRSDKFYNSLLNLIQNLKGKGYEFITLTEVMDNVSIPKQQSKTKRK